MRVDRWLTIGIPELSAVQWRALEKKLTYMNSQGDVVISYRKLLTKSLYILPRGAWYLLPDDILYVDKRTKPELPELKLSIELDNVKLDSRYEGQSRAVKAMFKQEQGLIVRPPGTGKTQIACAFAAKCKTRTLVLVHTEDILQQWVEYVENAIPELKGKVGVIRGKTRKIGHITIATVQTLNRSYLGNKEFWKQWGALIADEGHHSAAPSWEAVINACPAYYRFGFTASATRADGMHPSMRFIIGPVIHRQKFSSPVKLQVIPVRTNFRAAYRGHFDWGRLLRTLISDDKRNKQAAEIADREVREGNSVLVLSRRIEHLENIQEWMREDSVILAAKIRTKKERREILEQFRKGEIRCILATQLADEALDIQRLNRVLLVHPGKHEGRIIQQIGRALRQHKTKHDALIYDFIDAKVGVLRRQWGQRKRTYRTNGIDVKPTGRLIEWLAK